MKGSFPTTQYYMYPARLTPRGESRRELYIFPTNTTHLTERLKNNLSVNTSFPADSSPLKGLPGGGAAGFLINI